MAEDPVNALSGVGRHFGFSKQYAWYVYQKISGCPYSEVLKIKQLIRKKMRLDSWKTSKDVGLLMKLKEQCGRARSHILAGVKPAPEGWPATG